MPTTMQSLLLSALVAIFLVACETNNHVVTPKEKWVQHIIYDVFLDSSTCRIERALTYDDKSGFSLDDPHGAISILFFVENRDGEIRAGVRGYNR